MAVLIDMDITLSTTLFLYNCRLIQIKKAGSLKGLTNEWDFPWQSQATALWYPYLRHSSSQSEVILWIGCERNLGQRMD